MEKYGKHIDQPKYIFCIDWCSSECRTWFDVLTESSQNKITEVVDNEIPTEMKIAANSSLAVTDDNIELDFKSDYKPQSDLDSELKTELDPGFEIDEEDLRLLKNVRIRLEGKG